ncbi:MAG: hypothetical protein R3B90_20730 [Planctomycetaceae bacterium]
MFAAGEVFKLCGPTSLCREVLRVTGIDQELEVLADVVVAAGSFAR